MRSCIWRYGAVGDGKAVPQYLPPFIRIQINDFKYVLPFATGFVSKSRDEACIYVILAFLLP
jgi:hypothetical protein